MKQIIRKILSESIKDQKLIQVVTKTLEGYNRDNADRKLERLLALRRYFNVETQEIIEAVFKIEGLKVIPLNYFKDIVPYRYMDQRWAIAASLHYFDLYQKRGDLYLGIYNNTPLFAVGEDGAGSVTFYNPGINIWYEEIVVENNRLTPINFIRSQK